MFSSVLCVIVSVASMVGGWLSISPVYRYVLSRTSVLGHTVKKQQCVAFEAGAATLCPLTLFSTVFNNRGAPRIAGASTWLLDRA